MAAYRMDSRHEYTFRLAKGAKPRRFGSTAVYDVLRDGEKVGTVERNVRHGSHVLVKGTRYSAGREADKVEWVAFDLEGKEVHRTTMSRLNCAEMGFRPR